MAKPTDNLSSDIHGEAKRVFMMYQAEPLHRRCAILYSYLFINILISTTLSMGTLGDTHVLSHFLLDRS
jgi:hypothetical protein